MTRDNETSRVVHHQMGDREGNREYWENYNRSFRRLSNEGYCWEDRVDLYEYYIEHQYN